MRLILFAFLALIVAVIGYAYATNPVGCQKLISDAFSLGTSVSPVHVTSGGGVPMDVLLNQELVLADGSNFTFPPNTPATPTIKYYLIYYAAQADPKCQAFTPALVKWYKKFKPNHRELEVIFVSNDPDTASMFTDMKASAMPWPAFKYNDITHDKDNPGIERFAGTGLPDLVLVDTNGKVLSDSFNWSGTDLGPQHVLSDIEGIVLPSAPLPPPPSLVTFNANLPPVKLWAPPATMPAQPNWTWTMADGTVYQNVVVTKIEAGSVTITHSLGAANVATDLVPPDIQKQLNYDPDAAACASRSPYSLASIAHAETVARDLHRPIAWVAAPSATLTATDPPLNSDADLAQMALAHLKPQAIIVLIDDPNALDPLPAAVRDQFLISDDGPLPPGRHFAIPKIVFSTPDGTQIYGRVASKLMKDNRETAIDAVLTHSASLTQSTPPALADSSAPATAASPSTTTNTMVSPVKPWTPPAVIPAQPNWTWTTSDGTTYQNVVVTSIEPDTVSITHSMGVAHVPIALLPPDMQKALNYDPVAAAAMKAENEREAAHPYYTIATLSDAQAAAQQKHWPLAWVVSGPDLLSVPHPESGSYADFTQMSMDYLKSKTIIVSVDGYSELGALPANVRDELFHLDDGVLPGGHHFYPPKTIFSTADISKTLGRVSYTQLKASGTAAFDDVLANIFPDTPTPPIASEPATNAPPAPAAPTVAPATSPAPVTPATTSAAPPAPASGTPVVSAPVPVPEPPVPPPAPPPAPASNPAPEPVKSSQ